MKQSGDYLSKRAKGWMFTIVANSILLAVFGVMAVMQEPSLPAIGMLVIAISLFQAALAVNEILKGNELMGDEIWLLKKRLDDAAAESRPNLDGARLAQNSQPRHPQA